MPSLKTIRKRITSVKSTQKITRAMKMVAGARLNRAQPRIVALRPYAVKTQEVLSARRRELRQPSEGGRRRRSRRRARPPAPRRRPEKNVALPRAHQRSRPVRRVQHQHQQGRRARVARAHGARRSEVESYTVGRKGREYLRAPQRPHRARLPAASGTGLDLDKARMVARTIVAAVRARRGRRDLPRLQRVQERDDAAGRRSSRSCPCAARAERSGRRHAGRRSRRHRATTSSSRTRPALLERLVPMYVEISIFRALLERGVRARRADDRDGLGDQEPKDMIARSRSTTTERARRRSPRS